MNRKWMVWMVAPVLVMFLAGCPKKKPATPPQDLDVETTTVAPAPAPVEEVTQPAAPAPVDVVEQDPLASQDMQIVNDELRRRGFSPDVAISASMRSRPARTPWTMARISLCRVISTSRRPSKVSSPTRWRARRNAGFV